MPRRLVVVLAVVPLLALGACSSSPDPGPVNALASELAAALTSRDLGALPVEGGGQEALDALLAGVDQIPATVSVQDVDVDGDTATVALSWRWATRATPWTYRTTADLRRSSEQWRVQWSPTLVEPSLTGEEVLDATSQPAHRGDILGAGDEPLVTLRPVVRFGLDKARVPAEDSERSAKKLAAVLGIDPQAFAARVEKAGAKAFVEALVLRKDAAAQVDQASLQAIPGARALAEEQPLAPSRGFAAEILGTVGPATKEIIEASDGRVWRGDVVGLSGLQRRYDEQLGGTPGVVVDAVGQRASEGAAAAGPASGAESPGVASPGSGTAQASRTLFSTAPIDGSPLRTTLDEHLQTAAEKALDGVRPASAVVALRPSTGEVLAAANGDGSHGYGTATVGQYAPGSTMKVVTALALMRAGVRPSDPVPCTTKVVVDGKAFTNYDDYPADRLGQIPLRSAVANSCNTAIISQRDRLTATDLTQAGASLGLGVDHDLGFPVYLGQVPAAASQTGKAAAMIGQGKVLASPMAMAAVAASVAEGRTVVPHLLGDQPTDTTSPAQQLTADEARALRDMMRAVVTEGTATFLADLPGPPVGAKTGTAEFGTGDPLPTHAWMIATQGDLAVAVFVERGASGSGTAGPILEDFMREAR